MQTYAGLRRFLDIYLIYTLFGNDAPEGANKTVLVTDYKLHLFSAALYQFGQGKLGSLCRELTSTNSMGDGRDSNPQPYDCQARTPTTASSC